MAPRTTKPASRPKAKARPAKRKATKTKAKTKATAPATRAPSKPPAPQQAVLPGIGHDDQPASLNDALQAMATEAKRLADAGRHVPHHLAKALREAWIGDLTQHIWPSTAAAATDLGVTAQTLRNWASEGMPLPRHQPVPKAPVLRWLYDRISSKQQRQHTDTSDLDDRLKAAKLERLEGNLIAEAEDRAKQALHDVMHRLKGRLLHELPQRITDQLPPELAATTTDQITTAVRDLLTTLANETPEAT